MTNIILSGCNGKMGQVISGIVRDDENAEIVAGIDVFDGIKNTYPVFTSIEECDVEADVIIDFAAASAVDALVDYSVKKQIPLVLCTTGLSTEQIEKVNEASKKVAILRSANMSLGINTIFKVLQMISPLLSEAGFDIEIVEKHHHLKVDAPSGTALALADVINDSLTEPFNYKFDRSADRVRRPKNEIGISAVRGGTIVGDHEVIFAGEDEEIVVKHTAHSKAVFGKGAVEAAKFLKGKGPGMYTMKEVIG